MSPQRHLEEKSFPSWHRWEIQGSENEKNLDYAPGIDGN
jgi:hypothetical protein